MRTFTQKLGVAGLVAGVTLAGVVAPAAAAPGTQPGGTVTAVQAELAGWKKALLTKRQVLALSGIQSSNVDLVKTYNDGSTYAKTWAGERPGIGMSTVIVQVGKMPSKGWTAAAKGYAKNGGWTVKELSVSTLLAQRSGKNGMKSYAVLKNAGSFYVLIELSVPNGSATDKDSYMVAEKMAEAQKQQLAKAGYVAEKMAEAQKQQLAKAGYGQ